MEELEKLYEVLTRDGFYTKSFEEFQTQSEDPEYQNKVYEVVSREGLFTKSKDEFVNKYFVKKKDGSLPTGEEEVMVSDTQVQMEEPGSSDVSDQEQQVEFAPIDEQQDIEIQQIQEVPNRTFADEVSYDDISYDTEAVPFGEGEQATAIERTFGKNEFTDFFGDIYRAGVQGQAQGGTVDESL